ncbi:MAG: prolipoprotein diacylglyceryl transferase [Hyphomonadaceae bacterium]
MLEAALQFPNLDPVVPFMSFGPFEVFNQEWGPFQLRWYALAYIAGLLLGWRYIVSLLRKESLWAPGAAPMRPIDADDLLFWATLGVILGGRIGYVAFYMLPDPTSRAYLAADPLTAIRIWDGGMSFHGGLIGVGLAIWHFARTRNAPLLRVADLAAAATPIGLFFGRLANFINAELYGRPTDLPWGMRFPAGGFDEAARRWIWLGNETPRHPSQLYEAALEGLLLFFVLRIATHRFDSLKRPGMNAGIFLVGYGIIRAGLEQVRSPDAHMPHALQGYVTMGFLLSIPMIIAGAWLIHRALRAPPAVAPAAP